MPKPPPSSACSRVPAPLPRRPQLLRQPGFSGGAASSLLLFFFFFFFSRTFMSARLSRLYNLQPAAFPPYGRSGRRLAPSFAARSRTRSKEGPSLGPCCGAAGRRPSAVLATASWIATERAPHQRLAQPAAAALLTAGGARRARRRTRSRTNRCDPSFHRPPISEPRTNSLCGPRASSGYVDLLRRSATFSIAPSTSTVQGCG